MPEQKALSVEDDIKNAALSASLQRAYIDFCRFLEDNKFSVETEADGNGWQILYANDYIGHLNFTHVGVWLDTCDFGDNGSADDALKETTWAHVRICEHFSSDGRQCGCGNQPGSDKMLFGKLFEHLCFAHLEFLSPDSNTLETIKRLLLLFKQNRS